MKPQYVIATWLVAVASTASAGSLIAVPKAMQGAGQGEVVNNIPNYWGPSGSCYYGAGSSGSPTDTGCSASAASNVVNVFDPRVGSGGGESQAWADGAGMHIYGHASGVNYANTRTTATVGVGDQLFNLTSQDLQFVLTLHVDGGLAANGAGGSWLFVNQAAMPFGSTLKSWMYELKPGNDHATFAIDDTLTLLPVTVAAGHSASWWVQMQGRSYVGNGKVKVADSTATVDARNTLSIIGVQVWDALGNPVDASSLSSQNGWVYASAVPELPPVTTLLAGLIAIFWRARRSSSVSATSA